MQKALLDVLNLRSAEALQRALSLVPGSPADPTPQETLEFLGTAVSEKLSSMKLDELKAKAQSWGVEAKGKKKQAVVNFILESPAGAEAAFTEFFGKVEQPNEVELEAIGRDIEQAVKEAESSDLLRPEELDEIRRLLEQHKALAVNFREPEQLMGRAMQSLGARDMEDALRSVQNSMGLAQQAGDNFRRFATATLLSAADNLINTTHLAESNDHEAKRALSYALSAYRDGLPDMANAIHPLVEKCVCIFKDELIALNEAYQTKRLLVSNFKNQGVDTFNAERYMRRIEDALSARNHSEAWEYLEKAEKSVVESRNAWMTQIQSEVPVAENVIQEARHLGADTQEAERLIAQARVAMDARDYALCAELTKRSTRKAMEAQQQQIERAGELQRRQLQKADSSLATTYPLLQEARAYGMDIAFMDQLAQSLRVAVQAGDYVNATSYAKDLEEAARLMRPKVEAERERVAQLQSPLGGPCPSCQQNAVRFLETGFGRCLSCGYIFSYQIPQVAQEKKKWGLFRGGANEQGR
ncbi:MAG: hypothetical protein V1934_00015 [Methanobacteriota archaeon]